MSANRVCPGCGGLVPLDTIWVYQMKFFCTQVCVDQYRKSR